MSQPIRAMHEREAGMRHDRQPLPDRELPPLRIAYTTLATGDAETLRALRTAVIQACGVEPQYVNMHGSELVLNSRAGQKYFDRAVTFAIGWHRGFAAACLREADRQEAVLHGAERS